MELKTDPGSSRDLGAIHAEERAIMNRFAPHYRSWLLSGGLVFARERRRFVAWMLHSLRGAGRDPRTLRYLEVGCSTGEILEPLSDAGCSDLIGVELAERMLAECRRHVPAAKLVQAAVEELPFADGTFDVVIAVFTIHHLRDADRFFQTASGLLADGGWLFVLELNDASWAEAGRTKRLTRIAAAPLRSVLRRKNRARLRSQPPVWTRFNAIHRLRTREELVATARDAGFEPTSTTHGVLARWLHQDLFAESRIDRWLWALVARLDLVARPFGAGWYLWMSAPKPNDDAGGRHDAVTPAVRPTQGDDGSRPS